MRLVVVGQLSVNRLFLKAAVVVKGPAVALSFCQSYDYDGNDKLLLSHTHSSEMTNSQKAFEEYKWKSI